MKSPLNITVSCYQQAGTKVPPRNVNLLTWLQSKKYKATVDMIRSFSDKSYRDLVKKCLPCITPSGVFSGKETNTLVFYNGLMSLDFDNVQDIQSLKSKLTQLPYIAYCGLSVSGRGLWAIVPISKDAQNYKLHYEAIKEELQGYGITELDSLNDIIRMRFYSYDDQAYFNHNAIIYNARKIPEIKTLTTYCNADAKYNQVLAQIQILEQKHIDITETYSNWIALGAAFQNQFAEQGRALFHRLSSLNPNYDYSKCDKQYTHCAKMTKITIARFFYLTKPYIQ